MSGDVQVLMIAVVCLAFTIAWAVIVAWAAWRFGRRRD